MALLSLRLLGPFQAELDGRPVAGFRSDKVRALLAYLALEAQRPWPRATLAALLWPEFPESAAQSNLRNALSNLRRVLGASQRGAPFLIVSQATVQFNLAAGCRLDAVAFLDLLSAAELAAQRPPDQAQTNRLQEALALYRGEFLEGFALDSAPFESWLLATREMLRLKAEQAARELTLALTRLGELAEATAAVQHWLTLDPLEESAHRHLMTLLARRGQRHAALAQYETCRRLLRVELDAAPDEETSTLYAAIKEGCFPPRTDSAPAFRWPGLQAAQPAAAPPLFVARRAELAALNGLLDRAVAGEGGVYFVAGEAGSGKTALLAALARQALDRHPQLLTAWGQGNAFTGQGDPYYPFVQLTRAFVGEVGAPLTADTPRPGAGATPVARAAAQPGGPAGPRRRPGRPLPLRPDAAELRPAAQRRTAGAPGAAGAAAGGAGGAPGPAGHPF